MKSTLSTANCATASKPEKPIFGPTQRPFASHWLERKGHLGFPIELAPKMLMVVRICRALLFPPQNLKSHNVFASCANCRPNTPRRDRTAVLAGTPEDDRNRAGFGSALSPKRAWFSTVNSLDRVFLLALR